MKKLLVVGLMLTLIPHLVGCGDSESTAVSDPSPTETAAKETSAAPSPEEAHPGDWAALKRLAGRYSNRLVIPSGPAPKREVVRDLKIGRGPVVQRGDYFEARYVSFNYEDAEAVEPYWRVRENIYSWGLGKQVDAWEVGLKGIRVGGIRELIAPPSLAYGDGTRVYVVQVLRLV